MSQKQQRDLMQAGVDDILAVSQDEFEAILRGEAEGDGSPEPEPSPARHPSPPRADSKGDADATVVGEDDVDDDEGEDEHESSARPEDQLAELPKEELARRLAAAERALRRRKERLRELQREREQLFRAFAFQDAKLRQVAAGEAQAQERPVAAPQVGAGAQPGAAASAEQARQALDALQLEYDEERGTYILRPEQLASIVDQLVQQRFGQAAQLSQREQERQRLIMELAQGYPEQEINALMDAYRWLAAEVLRERQQNPELAQAHPLEIVRKTGLADEFRARYPHIEVEDLIELDEAGADPWRYGYRIPRVLQKYAPLFEGSADARQTAPRVPTNAGTPAPPRSRFRRPAAGVTRPESEIDRLANADQDELLGMTDEEYAQLRERILARLRS